MWLFLANRAVNKDMKENFADNYFQNTLRFFDVSPSFPFTANETKRDY